MLIRHATIVTMNPARDVIADGLIAVDGTTIAYVGPEENAPAHLLECSTQFDASGMAVFPGLINMHTHSYQALIKGLASDRPLDEWLEAAALPAANHLTEESAEAGALVTALENAHSGVTTVVDMFPRVEPAIFDAVMRGYDTVGLNAVFAAGFMHPVGASRTADEIESMVEALIVHAAERQRTLMLAPFQVWNNSSETLRMTARLSERYGLRTTVHAQETSFDAESTQARHGASELEALERAGLLDAKLSIVHGVTCTPAEMARTAGSGASICYSPVCNMYLGAGFAPIPSMRDAGINVCLATEGAGCNNSNDMLETLKFAALSQKAACKDAAALVAQDVLEMATVNAAKALGLAQTIGSLEAGKQADLFVLDPFADAFGAPMHDPVSTLVYSATPRSISIVIANGRLVMEGGRIGHLDEPAVLRQCAAAANELVRQAGIGCA